MPRRAGPRSLWATGVVLGAALIGLAAVRGIPQWQSIPSTWDAVWHANTIRFILDTGQASPTHMGELRNIETHEADTDPRVAEAVKALNIRYVVTSTPVVRGFVMPDGLVSLGKSRSWAKIYDNGEARIYEWRGGK